MQWNQCVHCILFSLLLEADRSTTLRCHMGKTIVYDTVSNLSWSVDIRNHGIVTVIEKVLGEPWSPSLGIGREVPEAVPQDDCVVRFRLVVLFQVDF